MGAGQRISSTTLLKNIEQNTNHKYPCIKVLLYIFPYELLKGLFTSIFNGSYNTLAFTPKMKLLLYIYILMYN